MAKANKFGVFGGVFVPSILTILGVIMYMRLPLIVGEAGLWYTLGIIVIAHVISITTGLSISSIATNKKVEAGGPYYIISRSLGLPIGGTLGLALFVGLSFSISLYLIGFAESIVSFLGYEISIANIRLVGSIALILLTIITFISTSLAIKTQYFILAAVGLSLLSIFMGNHEFAPSTTLFSNPNPSVSMMVLFGIFFPAVTGFTAGVSMSGDLKDPKKAIPIGTIAAIVVGFIIYIALAIFLATSVTQSKLIGDSEVLLNTAWIPELVIAGIWGATLSSALGSILGAPRILQAIAKDKMVPSFFGKGHGAANEPRNAILLAFMIAEAGILIGELNVIARIVSIFFITTYGILNLTAAFEKWTSLDFQPEFKISGWISITGAFASLLVMIQLDLLALGGAVIVLGAVYFLLKRNELSLDSGDAWAGIWTSLVKTGLIRLSKNPSKMRNWRPNIIMFTGNPLNRPSMIELGKAIVGKLGILSAFELEKSDDKILAKSSSDLVEHKNAIDYFQHKYLCRDIYNGMDEISRIYGFSGIEPNTIMMGWSKEKSAKDKFIGLLESFQQNKYNTLFFNYNKKKKFGEYKTIDIWWSGRSRNLSFVLYLLRQISTDKAWRRVQLRILIINPNEIESEKAYSSTLRILQDYRFEMEVKIIDNGIAKLAPKDIIANESRNADLTILGLLDAPNLDLNTYYEEMDSIVTMLNTCLIINASDEFEMHQVLEKKVVSNTRLGTQKPNKALPVIIESQFKEINLLTNEQDDKLQGIIDIFYENAIQPIFNAHKNALKTLKSRLFAAEENRHDIDKIRELVKRKRAIDKLKGDTIYQLNLFINQGLKEENLNRQEAALEDATKLLLQRLDETVVSASAFSVICNKELFKINADDTWQLKWYKQRKILLNKILGGPIKHQVYFKTAISSLKNKNILFVEKWLVQILKDEITFYDKLRSLVKTLIENLNNIDLENGDEKENTEDQLELITTLENQLSQTASVYKERLQFTFRQNLNRTIQSIEPPKKSKKDKKLARKSRTALVEIDDFLDRYWSESQTALNMLSLEVSVLNIKNRQHALIEDFIDAVKMEIKSKFLQPAGEIIEQVQEKDKVEFVRFKPDVTIDKTFKELFDGLEQKIAALTGEMPKTLEVYPLDEEGEETIIIPVSTMAEYFINSRFSSPFAQSFEDFLSSFQQSIYEAREHLNLVKIALSNSDGIYTQETYEVLDTFAELLTKISAYSEHQLKSLEKSVFENFEEAFMPMEPIKIISNAENFSAELRTYQGRKVARNVGIALENTFKSAFGLFSELYFEQSNVLKRATELFAKKEKPTSHISQLLSLKTELSPNDEVLKLLPKYYTSLFTGRSRISKEFWIPMPQEEKLFKQAFARFTEGISGGIMVIGGRNSGKTTFCKLLSQQVSTSTNAIYEVVPPLAGSSTKESLIISIKKATQNWNDINLILDTLTPGSILIFNDLELYWNNHENKPAAIIELQRLIDNYGNKLLFVVNLNPYAANSLNKLVHLNDHFLEIIELGPFSAFDLNRMITKRHRTSNLTLTYANKKELSNAAMSRLFNAYFKYSKGHSGTALSGWLASILEVADNQLVIKKPIKPNVGALALLAHDWQLALAQFVIHKRLTYKRLSQVCSWKEKHSLDTIKILLRSGLLVEKSPGIYQINPYVYPFLEASLIKSGVLKLN